MRLAALPLPALAGPASAARVDDGAAVALARPQELIVDGSLAPATISALLRPVEAFYGFWNKGSGTLLDQAIAPTFTDHTLPPGRPQGPGGPAAAGTAFLAAVPDLEVEVVQRLVVGDRVVSHLRFTGHFTGTFGGTAGEEQAIDVIRDGAPEGATIGHGLTYSAHPVSAAVGLAVMDLDMDGGGLLARGQRVGAYFAERLAPFADHLLVCEVRGRGMLQGLALVTDKALKASRPPRRLNGVAWLREGARPPCCRAGHQRVIVDDVCRTIPPWEPIHAALKFALSPARRRDGRAA